MAADIEIKERFLDLSHGKTRILEAGTGFPTILVHGAGFNSSADSWRIVMRPLAEKLHVISMDALNFGKGDIFDQEFSFGYMVDHIREVIDALGYEKVNFIGISMGGWLGALFGYESPNRINKLVLVAAGGTQSRPLASMVDWQPPTEETIKEAVGRGMTEEDKALALQTHLEKRRNPEHIEGFAKVMKHMTNPDTRIRYNTMRRLKWISVPTLVVWGTDDKTNDISMGHELVEGIPDAKFVVYEGIGHSVFQENPDQFVKDVLEFLAD